MKRYLMKVLPVIILAIICNTGFAQEISEKRLAQMKKTVERMGEVMELDKQEKVEILELKKLSEVKYQEINNTHKKGTEAYKNARKSINRKYQLALKKICSKEQMEAWRQYQNEKKSKKVASIN
ncbi:hypothetical protein [Carboxylicivirga sp. RSCT41]|uniref:hypothetical protein n=1 Tax=Carboxylicivirga agarovorans TaxID=3417570 RepID=UPI003D3523DC